jgi:chemotaxis signal transduction protein
MEMENTLSSLAPTADPAGTLQRPTEALDGGIVAPPQETAGDGLDTASVERLTIRIGGLHLLCATDVGREVILPPPASPLPHTPAWLLGVANVRGVLVPVLDLAPAFGVEREERLRRYLLILGHGTDLLGLLVDGLPVLRRFETAERLSGVPPHPPLLDGCLHGSYAQGGAVWIDVNIEGLLDRIGGLIAAPAH